MKNAISMKNHEFQKVYKSAKSIANNLLILYTKPCNLDNINKLGVCASKTVGNSIARHRACRLMREAYRHLEDKIKLNNYIIVIARPNITKVKEMEVEKALYHLLKKSDLLNNSDKKNNEQNEQIEQIEQNVEKEIND